MRLRKLPKGFFFTRGYSDLPRLLKFLAGTLLF